MSSEKCIRQPIMLLYAVITKRCKQHLGRSAPYLAAHGALAANDGFPPFLQATITALSQHPTLFLHDADAARLPAIRYGCIIWR